MNAITFPSVKAIEQLKAIVINIVSEETKAEAVTHLAKIQLAARQLKVDIAALKKPYKDEMIKIDQAAEPWSSTLEERGQMINRAIAAYNEKARKMVATYNTRALDNYEGRVANKEAEAVAAGKPIPMTLPPALKTEPAKTVHTEDARVTEVTFHTWDGIRGVPDGTKGAKDLTIVAARRLQLDLPEDWFVLDTALVTACVKRNDRVPSCIVTRVEKKQIVTA